MTMDYGDVDVREKKLKKETKEAVIALLDIAHVPPKYHERFCVITTALLEETYYLRKCKEMGSGSKKIENIEKAAWDLSNALQALTHEQYVVLRNIGAYFNSETSADWPVAAQEIIFACSCITGKNPHREARKRSGRGKGNVGDWIFQDFVRRLWRCAYVCRGKLTAGHKNNKRYGTMFTALERLESYSPDGVIPLSTQTIANIVKSMRNVRST